MGLLISLKTFFKLQVRILTTTKKCKQTNYPNIFMQVQLPPKDCGNRMRRKRIDTFRDLQAIPEHTYTLKAHKATDLQRNQNNS